MAGKEQISIREFARRVGVSDTAIRKFIEAGSITTGIEWTETGRAKVDYEIMLNHWNDRGGALVVKSEPNKSTYIPKKTQVIAPPPPTKTPAGEMSVSEANRRAAVYKSQMMGLELAEKQGTLVNKQKVYKALFEYGQVVKTDLLAIPDRHIDEILAAENRNIAHQKLYEAISKALEQLTTNPSPKID